MTSLGILLAFQTSEFIIYVWFFNYRYKNDNGNVRKLLTEDVIRSRNMKNIGTFVGQFYGFLMEYSFLFLVFMLTCFSNLYELTIVSLPGWLYTILMPKTVMSLIVPLEFLISLSKYR